MQPGSLSDYFLHCIEQNIGRRPAWRFPALPAAESGLAFERLTFENWDALPTMFQDDPDPWVDPAFKEKRDAYEYVANLMICTQFSSKRGGADWLVRTPGGDYAGVLHIYDLSKETIQARNRWCRVGYAFAAPYRGSGLPQQAMSLFQHYLFKRLNMLELRINVKESNQRSLRFAHKLGYIQNTQFFTHDDEQCLQLHRSARAKTMLGRLQLGWDSASTVG